MNSLKKMVSISLLAACFSTITLAADNDASNGSIAATVGQTFSIQLNADKDCASIKPLNQINLLVNGIETGLHPLGCDPANNKLAFDIEKEGITATLATEAAWKTIMGSPWKDVKTEFHRNLSFTATQPADTPSAQVLSNGNLVLQIAKPSYGLFGAGLMLALWGALFYLGRNSGMLRDDGNQGTSLQHRTFSLGRVQMAWWFAIIMGCYIFIWMMSQDIPTLGSQALLLMGISGVTGLASVGLNAGKPMPSSSGKFFDDLVTDAYGVTLHRFQMLAVTVILGIMFVAYVFKNLSMPEFDSTLLSLMGIASGTYVGFKIPEKHTDTSNQTDTSTTIPAVETHKAGYTPEPEATGKN